MQATLTQEPPIHCRSTTAVRRPDCAMCRATRLPPVPPPRTTTSNRSGWDMRTSPCELRVGTVPKAGEAPAEYLFQINAGYVGAFPDQKARGVSRGPAFDKP